MTMEHGFYHPEAGYWQTTDDVPQHILNGYPEGTVEIPLKPGENYNWNGTTWEQSIPTVVYKAPIAQVCCVATLDFDDFEIDGVQNGAGMSVAFILEPGKMWVFFEGAMPNSNYPWNVSSSSGKANVTDRQPEYLEITVTDDAGAPVAMGSVSLQIFKVG